MKITYFSLLLFVFSGCNWLKNDADFQQNPQGLHGTWQMVASVQSDGYQLITSQVKNGRKLHFSANGNFSISTDEDLLCLTGTYELAEDKLVLDYACEIENTPNPFVYRIIFEEDYFTISPRSTLCRETCYDKFKKLKTSIWRD